MPPRKKAASKKKKDEEMEEMSDEEEVVEELQTDFAITVDDDVKPFTNDYDELVKFDSLEKLPSEVVFEIFSFLPTIPYYFKLQLLNKFYREKFKEIIANTMHLDLTPLNFQQNPIWEKVCEMVENSRSSLKSIQLGELSYRWNHVKDSIFKKCKQLEEIAFVTPTHYFTSLFKKEGYNYGFYGGTPNTNYDEDKKNRDVWSKSLRTLNIIGLEKPRKGRRNNNYLLTASTMKYLLEKFPKLENINFILTNYTESYIKDLYTTIVNNRKKIIQYREKGGSTDDLYERSVTWYDEPLGIVDFEVPMDVKISVQGNIGKLNSLDAAKNIIELYNINPNTKFEFVFQKASNGTLLDQIIGSRAAYKQKHQVINYLLNNGSLISNLSANSWVNILKQPHDKIKKLLEEITKWVASKNEGKMLPSNVFSIVVSTAACTAIDNFAKNLQVMLDNGWSDVKDPTQDFITPSILHNDLCSFMIEKAGCKINPTTSSVLLSSAIHHHYASLPTVLKLVPEKLVELNASSKTTLSMAICNSDVPDFVISYILDQVVKPDYALSVFTNAITGDTIIHELVSAGRVEPLRQLLDVLKEQDRVNRIINIQNNDGETALHYACRYGRCQLAKDMVKYFGANKNLYSISNVFPYSLLGNRVLPINPEMLKPDEEKVEELKESIKKKQREIEIELEKERKKKKAKKPTPKRKKEESEEEEVEEEEEEEKPRRSSRKKTKKQEVDLTNEEEEEEEEEVVKPKRKARTSRKKKTHTDYVTCLAAPTNHLGQMTKTCSTFCSGGLDCSVFVWDAERLCSIRSYFESFSNSAVGNQQVDNQEFSQKPFQQYDIQSLQNYYPPHLNPQPKHSVYALDISTCGNQGTLIEQHLLVAAGSTDQLVRLYDLRTSSKVGKLRGHKDNIRCLKLSSDGKNCITGSTDGTVKYWDLRNQRCLQTFSFNSSKTTANSSIWTLEFDPFDPDQTSFTIGTKDGVVYYLDVKNKKMCTVADLNGMSSQSFTKHSALCTSIAPKGGRLSSTIWVGSTDSNIYEFEYGKLVDGLSAPKDVFSDNLTILTPKSASNSYSNAMDMSPVFTNLVDYSPLTPKTPNRGRASSFQVQRKPTGTLHCHPKSKILGCPGIISHFILNCRKRVLVKDTSGRVTLWDITTGNMIKDYSEQNSAMMDDGEDLFEKLCDDFSKEMISVRNWFTVEKKLGCLEIVLNPNDSFNAENYALESGFPDAFEEEKVNYGVMMIQALFRNWRDCRNEVLLQQMSEEDRQQREEKLNEQKDDPNTLLPERKFNLPENTSVIIHFEKNDTEKSPFKKQLRHFDGHETELTHIPQWVIDIMRGIPPNVNPQSHKLSFYLEPSHDEKYLGPLLQNHAKLFAHRILRIYKVASHIVSKLNLELPTVKELEESKKQYYEMKAREHEENPQIPLITQQDDENFDDSLIFDSKRDPNEKCDPEEFIEIICYGNRMKNNWNLAIANAFYRPNNVSWITLNYRQRYRTK